MSDLLRVFSIDLIANNILSHLSMPDIMSVAQTCRTTHRAVYNLWDCIKTNDYYVELDSGYESDSESLDGCVDIDHSKYYVIKSKGDHTFYSKNYKKELSQHKNVLIKNFDQVNIKGTFKKTNIVIIAKTCVLIETECKSLTIYADTIELLNLNTHTANLHAYNNHIKDSVLRICNGYSNTLSIDSSIIDNINSLSIKTEISDTSFDTLSCIGNYLLFFRHCICREYINLDVDCIELRSLFIDDRNILNQLVLKTYLPKPPNYISRALSVLECRRGCIITYVAEQEITDWWLLRAAYRLYIIADNDEIYCPNVRDIDYELEIPRVNLIIPYEKLTHLYCEDTSEIPMIDYASLIEFTGEYNCPRTKYIIETTTVSRVILYDAPDRYHIDDFILERIQNSEYLYRIYRTVVIA